MPSAVPSKWRLLIPLCALAGASGALAQNAAEPQYTAHELFDQAVKLNAREMPYVPVQTAPSAKPTPAPTPPPVRRLPPTTTSVSAVREPQALPDGGRVLEAAVRTRVSAPAPKTGPALGLKYTIQKLVGRELVDVPADTVFHSGDRIQVKVVTSCPGYLYIISQGSSGTWKVRFPSAEIANGDNHVDVLHPYFFPAEDSAFTFDEQKGTEKLFIVVSREPVADIQNRIYQIQSGKPAGQSAPREKPVLVEARLDIPEATIDRTRALYSRDLVVEKIGSAGAGDSSDNRDKKEYPVYLVNPSGSPDSSLSADIALVHQ